jgi:hypothetical protein
LSIVERWMNIVDRRNGVKNSWHPHEINIIVEVKMHGVVVGYGIRKVL